ncbi:acetoacetyl-CoA reductase [Paraburkholderia lycopersici]|uniref:Acetoacetyl-CoA reductase n=1 Tax=Paraburkholderia lycopersici TaxID=416944 RepID=A0A1G6RJ22_9BURK|nr:acetoacetyl-CoA reductase [Paraburkholderia lycopersici]
MHGFTRALALEVAKKGVTVNTVSPGYLATKMVEAVPRDVTDARIPLQIPVCRFGQPDQVAALGAFLYAGDAAFITGADIAINGGTHMQ